MDHSPPAPDDVLFEQAGVIDPAKRVKRWAPRGKSGCVTCRRRRVKCNEAKPVCGQCVATKRYCAGPFYQDSVQGAEVAKSWATAVSQLGTALPGSVKPTNHRRWELVPEGWEVVEAYEYLGLQSIPHMTALNLMALGPPKLSILGAAPDSVNASAFLSRTFADRIVFVSCNQGAPLIPSEMVGTKHLWSRYYKLTQEHLHKVNHDITNIKGDALEHLLRNRVFERIADLMESEHILSLPNGWLPHLNGYFTLLRMFGIPKNIPKDNPCFSATLRYMITYAVVGNTLTSVQRQMPMVYDFTDDIITESFATDCFPPFPCPTKLFAEIVAINRLRLSAAVSKPEVLVPQAKAMFERINAFNAKQWKIRERFQVPDTPEVPMMARIFQLSVSLYAILSLRLEDADSSGKNWPSKADTIGALVQLMGKASAYPKCLTVMTWPAAVAGVALADGPAAGRNLVCSCLMAIDCAVLGYGLAAPTIRRLQLFWLSGKTGWDDCWNEFYLPF